MLKPEINITLFPGRKKKQTAAPEEVPTVDYIAATKEAAEQLGKKLLIGAGAIALATVAAATAGAVTVVAVHHSLNK